MTQYLIFLRNLLKGDLGTSMYTQQPVAVTILERMPATIQLALAALVISTAVAIPLGVISAVKQYSWIDHLCLVGSLVGISMPSFWLGLLLMLTFSLRLRWLPFRDGLPSQRIGRCAAAPDRACLYPGIWHGSIAGQGYPLQHAGGLGPRLHPDCPG